MRGKTLTSIILGTIMAISLTGCKQCKTEYSPVKTEIAVVTNKYHKNSYNTTVLIGKMPSTQHHPAINRVTFDGALDFQINNLELYNRFSKGDSATIHYKDVYKTVYSSKDENGRRSLISRELRRYDFVDAVKK